MTEGQALRAAREALGLSQDAIAALAGVSQMTVSRVETTGRGDRGGKIRRALEEAGDGSLRQAMLRTTADLATEARAAHLLLDGEGVPRDLPLVDRIRTALGRARGVM